MSHPDGIPTVVNLSSGRGSRWPPMEAEDWLVLVGVLVKVFVLEGWSCDPLHGANGLCFEASHPFQQGP